MIGATVAHYFSPELHYPDRLQVKLLPIEISVVRELGCAGQRYNAAFSACNASIAF